jgi:geranylgeranylglycerol-phosphate geranylgeranyltransferase
MGYWLVAVVALLVGEYYSNVEGFSLNNQLRLLLFSVLLYPCYVISTAVYDLDPRDRFLSDTQRRNFVDWYFKGPVNTTWVITIFFCWILMPLIIWLASDRFPVLMEIYLSIDIFLVLYFILLLLFHGYYAFWLLRKRDDRGLLRVRYETFIPVLIIAFSFFVGATSDRKTFHISLCLFPIIIFAFLFSLHIWEKKRVRDKRGRIGPIMFTKIIVLFLIGMPLAMFWLMAIVPGIPDGARKWVSTLAVALNVGLYISLFDLWRLTGIVKKRRKIQKDFSIHDLVPGPKSPQNYYNATLVSHAVAIILLPLMFLFGDFGLPFILMAIIHAILAFRIWYKEGNPPDWVIRWKIWRLVYGFGFFILVGLDVFLRRHLKGFVSDAYPSSLSGISASLFVAVLVAFLATPFVQYFTESTGTSKKGSNESRPRSLRQIIKGFFHLPKPSAVFRQAAVLSGMLFILVDFFYEFASSKSWAITSKASLIFWIYAGETILFSAIAFFIEHKDDKSGGRRKNVEKAVSTGILIVGILQTLRIITGLVIFLGVAAVGVVSGFDGLQSTWIGIAVALVAMASFAINDYYDWRKDVINAPHRAVPRGRLTPRQTLCIGLTALIAGTVIGFKVVMGVGLVLFLVGAIGGALYNELVRRLPEWKVAFTAAMCALIVFFDVAAFGLPNRYLLIGVACLVFVGGRELLMDVRDVVGDRAVGMRTLAVRIGDSRVEVLGFSLLLLSLITMGLFCNLAGGGMIRWFLVGIYGATIIGTAGVWFFAQWQKRRWIAIEVLKLSILSGIGVMIL